MTQIKQLKTKLSFKQLLAVLILALLLIVSPSSKISLAVESPSFPLICNLRNANEYFVGREDFLKNMHDFLFNQAKYHSLIVSGSIGSGKTQVITRFAELHKTNYEIIWWFDLSKNLDEQYRNFAKKWNKLVNKHFIDHAEQDFLEINLDTTNIDRLKEEVYDRLKTTKLNWLIILDKAEDSISSLKDIPKHNSQGYGHIILSTTNNVKLPNAMHLNPFAREESIELILKSTRETDPLQADALAGSLKDYPLAIAKACSYITSHSAINLREYNHLFLTKKQELWKAEQEFSLKREDFNSYKSTLFATLSLPIQEVRNESSLAYELLALSSFLDEKDIPETLLIGYFKINHPEASIDFEFKNALASLLKQSLLHKHYNIQGQQEVQTENQTKAQDTDSLFAIHEIVQVITQELLTRKEQEHYLNQAVIAINKLLPTNIYLLDELLERSDYLLLHINSLIKTANQFNLYNNEIVRLHLRLLEYTLPGIRNDQEAAKQISQIEELIKKVPKVEPITKIRFLTMKSAFLAWVKSDFPESLNQALEAYKLINQFSQEEHPGERLMIYNRLARLYNVMGDNEQAFQYAELGKELIKSVPGLYGYQKDFYKILVKIYLDSDDLIQALKYSELNLIDLNEFKKTAKENKTNKTHKQNEFNPNNLTLTSSDISAYLIHIDVLIRLKEYEQAKKKLDSLLELIIDKPLFKVHLYSANIVVFSSYVNAMLASNLKTNGNYRKANLNKAIKDILDAQGIYHKLFDETTYYKSRHIFMSHRFLGEIYEKLGDFSKAHEQYGIGLKILNNIYSTKGKPITDDLSDIYCRLAIINLKLNKISEAFEYYQAHQKVFGVNHRRSITLMKYFVDNKIDVGI